MEAVDVWNKALQGAMALPFVKVNREEFIRKELFHYCTPEEKEKAISCSPTDVLNKKQIGKIANGCISYHTTLVCATSGLAGLPGGWAIAGTIPADIAQFYAHVFALAQKLLYLYGWPDFTDKGGKLDDAMAQILTIFTGVMMGSTEAIAATNMLARSVAEQTAKRLAKLPLTRYAIYNVAKQVGKWIGIKLTRESFAKSVGKVIPLVGAPISAGLTYWTFKPMATKLKRHLDKQLEDKDK